MAYLASNRGFLRIPADGSVEIRREPGGGLYIWCIACSDELAANPERSLFECVSCGQTVTTAEADDLATEFVRELHSAFNIQIEEKRRGFWWLFTTWFGSKKRRRQLTS
jgi:hypothetical protein